MRLENQNQTHTEQIITEPKRIQFFSRSKLTGMARKASSALKSAQPGKMSKPHIRRNTKEPSPLLIERVLTNLI